MAEETSTHIDNGEATVVHEGTAVTDWKYNDEVAGQGDRPEWFKEKYSTVEAQAQAYNELEKRFGGFTGSPDEYTVNEGVDFDAEAPLFKGLVDLAKNSNMSNDLFTNIVEMYNSSVNDMMGEASQNEFKELGDNAQERLTNVNDWAKANLPPELQEYFNSTMQTANDVKLAEHFMKMGKEQTLSGQNIPTKPSMTEDELKDMQLAEDRYGNRKMSVDPKYREEVRNKMAAFYK